MRNSYNNRIDHVKTKLYSNIDNNLSHQLSLKEKSSDFMFSRKYGYMENGAMPMENFSGNQDFARMGRNGSSNIVGP